LRSTSRRLLRYVLLYKGRFALGLLATSIMGGLDTVVAAATGLLVKILGALGAQMPHKGTIDFPLTIPVLNITFQVRSFSVIFYLAAAIFATVLVKVIFVYAREYLMNSASNKVLVRIRRELFEKILGLPMRYFDRERTGGIMSRFTSDVANIEQAISAGIATTQNLIYAVIFTTALVFTSWKLTLLAVVIFPASGAIIKIFGDRIRAVSRKLAVNVADISAFLQERIAGVKVIKSFVREEDEKRKFAGKVATNYGYSMKTVRLIALLKPINEVLNNAGMIVVVLFCSWQFVYGYMKIDVITRFVVLMSMAYKPLKELSGNTAVFQKALASAARVFEMLDLKGEVGAAPSLPLSSALSSAPSSAPSSAATFSASRRDGASVRGEVEFQDVFFSYNERETVLGGVSFTAKPGETVALVGPSGAGKTTIIQLLPRFYEIDSGRILIDGVDIRDLDLYDLRSFIGTVSQETVLFDDTVRENIRYGKPDAAEKEVIEAARVANAHQFITELKDGYDTMIGERGVALSGGQRQRIAIARAVLSDPRILLLDEATSALDNESEFLVQEALERAMRKRTSLVVAHRLSTIYGADRIVVLDAGRVVETGRHTDLIARSGLYRRLYEMQFGEDLRIEPVDPLRAS
jgi:subfamily B ATP-binding cassette protein MsbA